MCRNKEPSTRPAAILSSIRRAAARLVALVSLLAFTTAVITDEQGDRRVLMGLKFFPALVAADEELAQKRTGDGFIRIAVLYAEDAEAAEGVAKRLSAGARLRDFPLEITTLSYGRLSELDENPPTAIFLAEWSPGDLDHVVRFGVNHQRMVFSPFKGDVGAGAATGILVGDRILPLVNEKALLAAGIRLEPFVLELASKHE